MAVTIQDVARKANVSVSTASRILNGGTKGLRRDAAQRAQHVLAAAKELGYQPNPTARGLVMKRTFNLGFIGTELDNPVRGKLIETLRQAALEKGYNLLVSGVRHGDQFDEVINNMMAQRVDGLILGNVQAEAQERVARLNSGKIPVVGFGREGDLPWDSVIIDYPEMTHTLTAHLIKEHGFKQIVYAGLPAPCPRLEGYRRMMEEAGFEECIGCWETDGFSLEDGKNLAKRVLECGNRPEAIVCHNDLVAIGLIAGLRSLNISVPRDMAVVGLDNIDMAEYMNPTLTTIGVDASELALKLFEMLLERIEGGCVAASRQVRCQEALFLRESCGCAFPGKY